MAHTDSSDLEELVKASSTIVVARHKGDFAQDLPLEGEGSVDHIKTLLQQFERIDVIRDETASLPSRFNVGDPNLATRIRLRQLGASGEAAAQFPVYEGSTASEPDGVVLFLRPSRDNPGANFVFTVQGAIESQNRRQEIETLAARVPYNPDAAPQFKKKSALKSAAATAASFAEPPPVPCHILAEVRYFLKDAAPLTVDVDVSMDGKHLFRRVVHATGTDSFSDAKFVPFRFSPGHHRLLVISSGMNVRFEKDINLTKPTWVIITYNHYGSDSTQRYKEGLAIEVYDHEVFPR